MIQWLCTAKTTLKSINVKCINVILFAAIAFSITVFIACDDAATNAVIPAETSEAALENPHAEGFDLEGSDPEAIALADEVMRSMGGRKAWDATRFLAWDFFGARSLVWDKKTGDVRIESIQADMIILMNVNSEQGRVWLEGAELTNPDSLTEYLDLGRQIWVNDSYWLVMPFKLKDSGVTLKHLGDYRIEEGEGKGAIAEVLELRFKEIGYTPQNRYRVYIPKESEQKLVLQWDYYSDNETTTRDIVSPWNNYKQYGNILLSGDRGERDLDNIGVYSDIPATVFTDFAAIDRTAWK